MKIETVVAPNEHIFSIQRRYLGIVASTLPNRHIELVGGMAVPMIGRPELDILVITKDLEGDTKKLQTVGFEHRGIADNTSFLKQVVEGVDVTVQIMFEDNKMIAIHRGLIALLRGDETLKKRYEEFKKTLSGLERYEYKKRKVAWMKENILPKLVQGRREF